MMSQICYGFDRFTAIAGVAGKPGIASRFCFKTGPGARHNNKGLARGLPNRQA